MELQKHHDKGLLLEFRFNAPRVYDNPKKTLLVTQNTASKWKRWSEPKIKKKLKDSLGEWTIPKSTEQCDEGTVICTILRPTKHRIDADSMAPVVKWVVDFLVEQGWFIDDDNIVFIFRPKVVDPSLVETMLEIEVFNKHLI